MNWTIGVSGTQDKTVAFARNERESYGQKDPLNAPSSHVLASAVNELFRNTGDPHPVEHPQNTFSPWRMSVPGRRKPPAD